MHQAYFYRNSWSCWWMQSSVDFSREMRATDSLSAAGYSLQKLRQLQLLAQLQSSFIRKCWLQPAAGTCNVNSQICKSQFAIRTLRSSLFGLAVSWPSKRGRILRKASQLDWAHQCRFTGVMWCGRMAGTICSFKEKWEQKRWTLFLMGLYPVYSPWWAYLASQVSWRGWLQTHTLHSLIMPVHWVSLFFGLGLGLVQLLGKSCVFFYVLAWVDSLVLCIFLLNLRDRKAVSMVVYIPHLLFRFGCFWRNLIYHLHGHGVMWCFFDL